MTVVVARQDNPPAEAAPYTRDSLRSYIHKVHNLIERCLLLNMDREECADALAKHAHVKPIITITVWKELEKVNQEFFAAYFNNKNAGNVPSTNEVIEEAKTKLLGQKK